MKELLMNIVTKIINEIINAFGAFQARPIVAICSSSFCTCCNEEESVENNPNIVTRGLVWLEQ